MHDVLFLIPSTSFKILTTTVQYIKLFHVQLHIIGILKRGRNNESTRSRKVYVY